MRWNCCCCQWTEKMKVDATAAVEHFFGRTVHWTMLLLLPCSAWRQLFSLSATWNLVERDKWRQSRVKETERPLWAYQTTAVTSTCQARRECEGISEKEGKESQTKREQTEECARESFARSIATDAHWRTFGILVRRCHQFAVLLATAASFWPVRMLVC